MKICKAVRGALCLALVGFCGPARAADQAATCDRACLDGLLDDYVAALIAHDPGRLPVAEDVKFTENLVPLAFGKEGLWRTATGRRDFNIYVPEPERGNVAWFGIIKEMDKPVFLAVRLKVEGKTITEVETLVGRSPLDNAAKAAPPRPGFAQDVAPADRSRREELIRIANTKWNAFEDTSKGALIPYADDCERHDNGVLTAGTRPSGASEASPAPGERRLTTCRQQMTSGRFNNGNTVDPRRIWAVDQQRGLVVGLFTPNVPGDHKVITMNNGEKLTAGPGELVPFTIEQVELFKIIGGKIHMVEVVYGPRVPYGMRSPFDMKTLWKHR